MLAAMALQGVVENIYPGLKLPKNNPSRVLEVAAGWDGTHMAKRRGGKRRGGGHSPAAQLRTDLSPWAITCLRGLNIKIKANFNSTKKRGEKKAELQFKELKSGWKIQSSFLPLQEHR